MELSMSQRKAAHIINDANIDLAECGVLLPYYESDEPTPWAVPTNGFTRPSVAVWSSDGWPEDTYICRSCAENWSREGAPENRWTATA